MTYTKGVNMPAAARIGDPLGCGDFIAQGSSDFFINGKPVALLGHATTGHGCFIASTLIPPVASTFFVNGKAAAFVGTMNNPHPCPSVPIGPHSAPVAAGSPDFIIGS